MCSLRSLDRVMCCAASHQEWRVPWSNDYEVGTGQVNRLKIDVTDLDSISDESVTDLEVAARVNIGFPQLKESRSAQLKTRLEHLKAQRASKQLEQLARNNKRKGLWYLSPLGF